jgi:FkbM family methyltransferase
MRPIRRLMTPRAIRGRELKQFVKSVHQRFGYDIVRHVDIPLRPFNVLDLVVDSYCEELKNFRFLQIGANDGVRDDPLHHIIRRYQLSGLLIEPLPDLFEQLKANYADCSGLSFECCAIGDSDAKFGIRRLEKYVVPMRVPVLTLSNLLKKNDMRDLSLLQVDTEGFDCRIVQSALRLGIYPKIINYEYVHCRPHERAECKRMLSENGYHFVDVGRDTLAVRHF